MPKSNSESKNNQPKYYFFKPLVGNNKDYLPFLFNLKHTMNLGQGDNVEGYLVVDSDSKKMLKKTKLPNSNSKTYKDLVDESGFKTIHVNKLIDLLPSEEYQRNELKQIFKKVLKLNSYKIGENTYEVMPIARRADFIRPLVLMGIKSAAPGSVNIYQEVDLMTGQDFKLPNNPQEFLNSKDSVLFSAGQIDWGDFDFLTKKSFNEKEKKIVESYDSFLGERKHTALLSFSKENPPPIAYYCDSLYYPNSKHPVIQKALSIEARSLNNIELIAVDNSKLPKDYLDLVINGFQRGVEYSEESANESYRYGFLDNQLNKIAQDSTFIISGFRIPLGLTDYFGGKDRFKTVPYELIDPKELGVVGRFNCQTWLVGKTNFNFVPSISEKDIKNPIKPILPYLEKSVKEISQNPPSISYERKCPEMTLEDHVKLDFADSNTCPLASDFIKKMSFSKIALGMMSVFANPALLSGNYNSKVGGELAGGRDYSLAAPSSAPRPAAPANQFRQNLSSLER